MVQRAAPLLLIDELDRADDEIDASARDAS
jgi:hypothetical protein